MRRTILIGTLVLLPLAAACGGDDDTTGSEAAPADEEASDTGGTDAAGSITIETFIFSPNPATVAAGSPVTVENKDTTTHTITAGTPDAPEDIFDEELAEGATVEFTVDEPGTYAYFCKIHNSMTGELVVE